MAGQIGILLAQLGTPEEPSKRALRRYLRQFLGDPRVIEMNPLSRWLLLNLVILPLRSRHSAGLYQRIWTPEGSPLLLNTRQQAGGLQKELGIRIAVGMRYGNPSLENGLEELLRGGTHRILLFPLFPQYSGATTGSLYDEMFRLLPKRRVVPALRVVPPYYDRPAYVEAVSAVAREHLESLSWKPEKIIFSYHGIPKRYQERGDPYRGQVERSARRIAASLQLEDDQWILAFQSRYGREEWLQPYTDVVLKELGRKGIRRIAVLSPGFTADCLETIDEIGRVGCEQFQAAGGEELSRVPCLNAHPAWIKGMARIARDELKGWIDF